MWDTEGLGTPGEHGLPIQLNRTYMDSHRLKQQLWYFHMSTIGPLQMLWVLAWCFGKSPDSASGGVSDSFACSWNLFPITSFPLPALRWGFIPRGFVYCSAVFICCPWKPWSLLGSRGWKRGGMEELGGVKEGNHRWDVQWQNNFLNVKLAILWKEYLQHFFLVINASILHRDIGKCSSDTVRKIRTMPWALCNMGLNSLYGIVNVVLVLRKFFGEKLIIKSSPLTCSDMQ